MFTFDGVSHIYIIYGRQWIEQIVIWWEYNRRVDIQQIV